ncbi:MAG: helix-turn-helix transcriptional regulator [Clostridia bacterium]|nr:helix-turn-helix transcriptional regulator [Clostridia bacterium]
MKKGNRIRIIRKLRGLTQKELGYKVGFSNSTAEIRVTQYENAIRNPKGKIATEFANALNVNELAINIPEINSLNELYHLLFVLEDEYGIHASVLDYELCLSLDVKNKNYESIHSFLKQWNKKKSELNDGTITQLEYDNWRYNYPMSKVRETQKRIADTLNQQNSSDS